MGIQTICDGIRGSVTGPSPRRAASRLFDGRTYQIEILDHDGWAICEADGAPARFATREDAETEARWSLGSDVEWRVTAMRS